MAPYAQWDIPVIGQSYLLFRALLAAPHSFSPGLESLETELFEPKDIPFDKVRIPLLSQDSIAAVLVCKLSCLLATQTAEESGSCPVLMVSPEVMSGGQPLARTSPICCCAGGILIHLDCAAAVCLGSERWAISHAPWSD